MRTTLSLRLTGTKPEKVWKMILRENDSQVLSSIPIDLIFADLAKRIPASPHSGKLLKTSEHTFEKVQGIWHPSAVLLWLPVAKVFETRVSLVLPEEEGLL